MSGSRTDTASYSAKLAPWRHAKHVQNTQDTQVRVQNIYGGAQKLFLWPMYSGCPLLNVSQCLHLTRLIFKLELQRVSCEFLIF